MRKQNNAYEIWQQLSLFLVYEPARRVVPTFKTAWHVSAYLGGVLATPYERL